MILDKFKLAIGPAKQGKNGIQSGNRTVDRIYRISFIQIDQSRLRIIAAFNLQYTGTTVAAE